MLTKHTGDEVPEGELFRHEQFEQEVIVKFITKLTGGLTHPSKS